MCVGSAGGTGGGGRHCVQGGRMLKGTGVSPSHVHTVDLKPPPSCSLHRTGCFDSPPTHAHTAGAALRPVSSAAETSATVLSVCSQKQLPVIQFFPTRVPGADFSQFKSGLCCTLPHLQVGEYVYTPIHSSGGTFDKTLANLFVFLCWPAFTLCVLTVKQSGKNAVK